jgi:two-component system cell cycle response regulator
MEIPVNLLQGWCIVVVDDEDDSLEVARYILDFYGADVHTATNGHEALDLIRRTRPNFVISDLSMPYMDGWELLRELKDDIATRDIPVIALTAHAMIGDRERAIAAGFHNYLTKPLTADVFIHDLLRLLMAIPDLNNRLNI